MCCCEEPAISYCQNILVHVPMTISYQGRCKFESVIPTAFANGLLFITAPLGMLGMLIRSLSSAPLSHLTLPRSPLAFPQTTRVRIRSHFPWCSSASSSETSDTFAKAPRSPRRVTRWASVQSSPLRSASAARAAAKRLEEGGPAGRRRGARAPPRRPAGGERCAGRGRAPWERW